MKGTKIMSVFQLFWNLILGISGGIISGIIVSRIFLIQGDFQNQINSFDLLLRKLGYTSGMIRTVQEFSYDSDIKMHNEMKKEGISTEEEYYKAHMHSSRCCQHFFTWFIYPFHSLNLLLFIFI